MQNQKYKTRKARSMQMLKEGVEPVKDGFNEYFIPSQTDKNKKYKITKKTRRQRTRRYKVNGIQPYLLGQKAHSYGNTKKITKC